LSIPWLHRASSPCTLNGMCAELSAADPYPRRQRLFDLVGAGLLLLVSLPLFIVVAVLVWLDSPGGVIFRQIRVGRHGRPFTLFKFRTMVADADPGFHRRHVRGLLGGDSRQAWSPPGADPRLTRLGRWLRPTCLDELPQLVNVVRGEMSLVGPRPALPYEVEAWQPWHHARLVVPPGITGPWQVNARGHADFDCMVRLDLAYIARRSIRLDLALLARTPSVVLRWRHGGPERAPVRAE